MLDLFFNIGSFFNWIPPVLAFIVDIFFGPVGDFGISASSGWYPEDIKSLLNQNLIKVWGLIYDYSDDILMFTVNAADAALVLEILSDAGVPIIFIPNYAFE